MVTIWVFSPAKPIWFLCWFIVITNLLVCKPTMTFPFVFPTWISTQGWLKTVLLRKPGFVHSCAMRIWTLFSGCLSMKKKKYWFLLHHCSGLENHVSVFWKYSFGMNKKFASLGQKFPSYFFLLKIKTWRPSTELHSFIFSVFCSQIYCVSWRQDCSSEKDKLQRYLLHNQSFLPSFSLSRKYLFAFAACLFLSLLPCLPLCHRPPRSVLHHRKGRLAAVGSGVQQLCARAEPEGHHQQVHRVRLGLLRCHLPGLLHCQSGCFYDPGGVCRPGVRLVRQKGANSR